METPSKYICLSCFCISLLLLSCKDQFPELQQEKCSQQENTDSNYSAEDEQTVCILPVEQMPEFPGGGEALKKFLRTHLRYPKTNACVNGVVLCKLSYQRRRRCH